MTRFQAPDDRFVRRLRIGRVLPAIAAALLGLAAVPGAATAHGGEAAIHPDQSRLFGGARTVVRGDDLEPETDVRLEIVTSNGPVLLTTAQTDADGHLAAQISVPSDLPPRYYEIRATLATGQTVSGYLAVISPDDELLPDGGQPSYAWILLPAAALFAVAIVLSLRRRPEDRGASRRGARSG